MRDTLRFFSLNSRKRDLSNPIRDPRFRVSASGVDQSAAFAFGVPHDINAFHRYTMSSADPFHPLSCAVSHADSRLSREI